MGPRLALTASLLIIGLLLPQDTASQSSPTKSQELAKWIMGIVLEKGQENEKLKRAHVTYNKKVIKSNLKKYPPQVLETSIFHIYGQNGQSFEKLIERDQRPTRNAQAEVSKLDFNTILLQRYDFNLDRDEFVNGRGYYVIGFKPKEPIDKLPFEDRLDEGLNRAAGYLYVDMEKLYLKRMEGKLNNSFSKGWGAFEMEDFSLIFEQEEYERIIVPSSLVLTYKYRVFWGDTHEKIEYFYNNRKSTHIPPE